MLKIQQYEHTANKKEQSCSPGNQDLLQYSISQLNKKVVNQALVHLFKDNIHYDLWKNIIIDHPEKQNDMEKTTDAERKIAIND